MLRTLLVREVVIATPRARIVRLDLAGHPFPFRAGQAVRVGTAGMDPPRAYSLAGSPEDAARDDALEVLVGVEPDGTAGPHLVLEPRGSVEVEGPIGVFAFPEQPVETHFLFVAGGTGIAPLRAMLRHALETHSAARSFGLIYSARTPDEFAYQDEFRVLADNGTIAFRQTVTREPEGWIGARGRIDKETLSSCVRSSETLCFVCGPFAMVDEIPRLLHDIGIARERIKIEEW